jgi:endonuclease/exonuclease/phosphatase (EEP) superfamily protein YafD
LRDRFIDRAPFTALGLLWPFGAPAQAPGPPPGGGRRFRLVSSNALKKNRRPRAWAEAVLALSPDVLCVPELTPPLEEALRAVGDGLPEHRCADTKAEPAGTGLWSRWPIDDGRILRAGHSMIVAPIPAIGATVAAIHTVAPASRRKAPQWLGSFDAITTMANDTPGPLVIAGDWNATVAHTPMRRLLAGGRVRDAHIDAGRPFARSWHARFPVALLDRVLVSPEVAVHSIAEHRVPGTDHRAVVAELEVVSEGAASRHA